MSRKVNDQAAELIKREWGDLPVVEAEHDLRVFIKPEDLKAAKAKDPGRCVFANACKRTFGSDKVLFFRSVAYVELRTEDGTRRVERFILTQGMRDLIELFDAKKPVIPDAGFLLKAPTPGQTMDGIRHRNNERAAREREAVILGTSTTNEKRNGKFGTQYKSKPLVKDFEIRNGTGAVHFVKAKEGE